MDERKYSKNYKRFHSRPYLRQIMTPGRVASCRMNVRKDVLGKEELTLI